MEKERLVLEQAQKNLQRAIIDFEKAAQGKINYREWSKAKGCEFAKEFESKPLPQDCLENCRVLPSRYQLIEQLPKGGTGAEVGTQFGDFAKFLLDVTNPQKLYLIDQSFDSFEEENFKDYEEGLIEKREGDSSGLLAQLDDDSLDWLYLDADHSYAGVKKDLEALEPKLKSDGVLICNDYNYWSSLEAVSYGVPKAIHEFCLQFDWEFYFLALHRWGYHDLALRRKVNSD